MTADPEIKKYEAVRDQCRAMAKDDPKGAYLNFQSAVMGFGAFPGIDAVWSDACRTLVDLMGPLARGPMSSTKVRQASNHTASIPGCVTILGGNSRVYC